ncbi:MAG: MFS transporter, partial [Fervidobacterium sp.]
MHNSTFDSSDRNVFILSITVFLVDTVLSSWFMVLPLYLEDLGAGILEVGFCYALINLAWFGSQIPGGLLSDRIGRKSPIVLSTFTFILCYSVLILARTWVLAALAIAIFWIFSGLQSPSFSSMIAESVIERKRPKAFATYSFLMNLGWAVG